MLGLAMQFFGVLLVLSACGVVFSKKPMHSALYLVLTLCLVAVHFALLGADFLAGAQILIYAGAIMVLVVFVVMLLGLRVGEPDLMFRLPSHAGVLLIGCFFWMLSSVFEFDTSTISRPLSAKSGQAFSGSVETVGRELFTKFLYPFELISVLLLAAIIGAVVLAFEKKRPLPPGRGLKAVRQEEE